ncbi:MAG: permease [Moorellaceae bacterium]
MKKVLWTYRFFLSLLLFDLIVLGFYRQTGKTIFSYTFANFREMLGIIPPIFILLGLLDTWVPRETVMRYMGERAGWLGPALSILLGAAAAGPLYGAFPVAEVMAKKGVRYYNIIVFLCAWATLKIPMFLFEMSALGVKFALTRWLVNLPAILLIAAIIERSMGLEEKQAFYQKFSDDASTCRLKN